MDFLETVVRYKPDECTINIHLVTTQDDFKGIQQQEYFEAIKQSCLNVGIKFTWEFDDSRTIHARHIQTDHGWKILLDRGLDIFQQYDISNTFSFASRLQRYRYCKAFEMTYIRAIAPNS